MTHALDVVCALLRTNLASWFTLRDLFDVLCTRGCGICGYFGGLLFVPFLVRICSKCIMEHPPFGMSSVADVTRRTGLSLEFLRQTVPVLSTISGKYHEYSLHNSRKTLIVAPEQVSKAAAASGREIDNKWIELPYRCELTILRRIGDNSPAVFSWDRQQPGCAVYSVMPWLSVCFLQGRGPWL